VATAITGIGKKGRKKEIKRGGKEERIGLGKNEIKERSNKEIFCCSRRLCCCTENYIYITELWVLY
jgi:hypothetical protein